MSVTVIQYVLGRLKAIGIDHVFGVPGDYSFAVTDAICNDPEIRWIGCCNELNAAYAADGYARIKGVATLCTTYGVGELSALNGVVGAYAEHLPLFHLVGTPNLPIQRSRALMHHTLGDGQYDLFRRMSEPVVCAHAVMTPQNVAYETDLSNQTLWGSIGWATPAAFGAAMAAPNRRAALVTGDGSHQLTAQEVGQFGRLGLKPIIFVLNNNGYLIERLLCADPEIAYNDIAQWRYAQLPAALGCDGWFTARVTTCEELDAPLATAAHVQTGVYIEVVTDTYVASPLALKLHASMKTLYGN